MEVIYCRMQEKLPLLLPNNMLKKYRPIQDRLFESDFDKEIKRIEGKLDKSDE